MTHEQESVVGTCFQCGKGMTEAEGGKIFTVCCQCWPDNPIAHQQAMQALQAQNHRLMTQLGEEIAESDELVKQRDDLTQQLAEQRAVMDGLVEALEGQRRRSNFTDQRCFCPDFHDTRRDGHTTNCQKAKAALAAAKGELSGSRS